MRHAIRISDTAHRRLASAPAGVWRFNRKAVS
jgi:hypothetical protein